MKGLRYGSVCSGIEAATVAWHSLGWEAAWLSEIEAFPSAVLAHHYPDIPNLGDMTKITPMVLNGSVEAPDVFVGGTPCQAFSVAGLRNSLEDDRGQLSITYIHLLDAIDLVRESRGEQPCVAVWENVPGVLSTKDNAFGCFLAGLAGETVPLVGAGGKWANAGCVIGPKRTVAWRILDAQYFGVAQRRRRVFVVASAREDFSPPKVLFEFEGMRRDTPPSREKGKATAGNAPVCASDGSDCSPTVTSKWMKLSGGPAGSISEVGNSVLIPPAVAYAVGTDCYNGAITGDVACTMGTPGSSVNASGPTVMQPIGAFKSGQGAQSRSIGWDENVSPTLPSNAGGNTAPAVAFKVRCGCEGGGKGYLGSEDQAMTLSTTHDQHLFTPSMQVRRLTPIECERLQGFPDSYTNIPWRKKEESPDGPRYKALGNSMAVPVMHWIGKRIQGGLL